MLACEDVRFKYPLGDRNILDGITTRFDSGSITAIIGPNGIGKSTLLRLLAGLLTPTSGRVSLQGRPIQSFSPSERARHVAYTAQRVEVSEPMSVQQVVEIGRFAVGRSAKSVRAGLALMGLDHEAERPFHHLSAGQQQRVSLARAIAQLGDDAARRGRQALILDEPTAALDPPHAVSMMSLFRSLADQGAAVIMSMHDLTTAFNHGTHAVLLSPDGSVMAHGPIRDVLNPAALRAAYSADFELVESAVGCAVLARSAAFQRPGATSSESCSVR